MKEIKKALRGHKKKDSKKSLHPVFVVLSLIANNTIISPVVYVLFIAIEGFHFLFFVLRSLEDMEYFKDFIKNAIDVTNYFRYLLENNYQSATVFVMILHIIIIAILTICGVAILIMSRKLDFREAKFVRILSTIASSLLISLTTPLLVPVLESFERPFLCMLGTNEYLNTGVFKCGEVSQIIFMVLGIICELLALGWIFLANQILVDDYWFSSLPWAGQKSEVQLLHGISKVILGIYLGLDINEKYIMYFLGLLLVIQIVVLWRRIDVIAPYSFCVYSAKFIQESLILSFYFYSFLIRLYNGKPHIFTLSIVSFIGIAWAVLAFLRVDSQRLVLLQKNWNGIKSVKLAENFVQVASSLCFVGKNSKDWRFFKTYFFSLHFNDCTDPQCICKSNDENIKEQGKKWFLLFETALDRIAEKFPKSHKVMLHQSYYQFLLMKNYFKSYYYLASASNLKSKGYEKFLIFRMKHIIALSIVAKESKIIGSTSLISILKFQKICTLFQELLKYTAELVISFWTLLDHSRINVEELYSKGNEITVALKCINELFRLATELNSDYPYLYKYYGNFLQFVLNSEDEGSGWVNKGADILKQQLECRTKHHENISKSVDSAIIVISGNPRTLGIVISANQHVESQLGLFIKKNSKEEIVFSETLFYSTC